MALISKCWGHSYPKKKVGDGFANEMKIWGLLLLFNLSLKTPRPFGRIG